MQQILGRVLGRVRWLQMPTRRFQEVLTCREVDKTPSEHASLVGLNDVADELFDVPEPSDSYLVENG